MAPPTSKIQDDIAFFSTTTLGAPLLSDPSYSTRPDTNPPFIDPLLVTIARTPDAIRRCLYVYRSTPEPEGHLLVHVGPGVCGQTGVAHGGFLATVMDEVCGAIVPCTGLDGGIGMFTVALNMAYKRPVAVPESGAVIAATVKVKRVEGRKIFFEAVIRNEAGEVCTTAETLFIRKKSAF
ncbi:PaaI family thioesterase [Aspergillus lucknowensis]|uniref:HotDog domain-containing protein n=1 Tax=Aspergillus lucknowensis TaxID=176173 RepID=A0ABR4M8B3_9EURO